MVSGEVAELEHAPASEVKRRCPEPGRCRARPRGERDLAIMAPPRGKALGVCGQGAETGEPEEELRVRCLEECRSGKISKKDG